MSEGGETTDRDPVDLLVELFLQRHRRGEPVAVQAFAAEHPAHADALLELLPTLLALEQMKREKESSAGSGRSRVALPKLERLGDFRIVGELGRGGMGVVFEAVQESLGRRVALKVLPQASLLTGSQLQRFRREAQIAAQLHHSNIVPVFGSGESDGYHWYAMQYIGGESLDRWRQRQAAAKPASSGAWRDRARFVAHVGVEAASALHYAHGLGTLHRDVKPANLLLEHEDHVWVTDFGLAKALEAEGLTQSGDLLGTLQYMAPEQFAGHYDVQSEVYSLGITLYELLVLQPAFAGKTRSELVEQIRTQRPPALRRACPGLPEDLAIVIERAMAREPQDRYRDAEALQRDLQAFLDDRPVEARRQGTLQLVSRWCRRNRAMATLAACTALAVVGSGITGWAAYVVTDEALGQARTSAGIAAQKSALVESNLQLTLTAFGNVFDALVGRDPAFALDEDPDTGEQTVVVPTVVEPHDVDLLQQMLAFYDRFATQNESSQALQFETARAHRRVGTIHARLGNLDAAASGYDKALERFREVKDRDVTREIAAVHVDYGQLEQRRGRPTEAVQRFRLALQLLGPDQARDSRGARLERAQAHFLLSRAGPGGRPGDRGREAERARSESRPDPRQELALARAILDDLLREEPTNPEFRALQARCLLGAGRRRPEGPERESEREADRRAAIDIFRQLVQEHPEADQYAYELCEALLGDRRRFAPGGRGRPEDVEGELVRLREAKQHAVRLVKRQPEFAEYQALRARVGSMLGSLLARSSGPGAGAPTERRAEAEAELRAALAIEEALSGRSLAQGPRFLVQSIGTRAALALLLADADRAGEAVAEVEPIVAALRQLAQGSGRERPAFDDPRLLNLAEALLQRLGRPELASEVRAMREQLVRPEREQPAPPHRGR